MVSDREGDMRDCLCGVADDAMPSHVLSVGVVWVFRERRPAGAQLLKGSDM